MNVTTIAGNVGKDSRLNSVQTNNGPMSVLNFSVAVQTSKKDQQTGKYISLWFDCALWGKRADTMVNYIKAGTKLSLSGEVGVDSYTDGQGQIKPNLTLNVRELTLQGGNQQQGQKQAPQHQQPAQQYQQQPQNNAYAQQRSNPPARQQNYQTNEPPFDFNDEIPFAPIALQYRELLGAM